MAKSKKFDFGAVVSAASAGAGYNFAIEAVAKRVTFVNDNFLVTKSLVASLIGSTMTYLAKPGDEKTKAAGYALIGVGGASAAAKLATVIVSEEPMNGVDRRARRVAEKITRRLNRGNDTPRMIAQAARAPQTSLAHPSAVVPGNIYGQLAFADTIYG